MAGSATVVSNRKGSGKYRQIIWHWTTDASGDVNGEGSVALPGGTIIGFWSIPDSVLSDVFELTLPGRLPLENGATVAFGDMLQGAGGDVSPSSSGTFVSVDASASSPTAVATGTYVTPTIASPDALASGYLILFFWEE